MNQEQLYDNMPVRWEYGEELGYGHICLRDSRAWLCTDYDGLCGNMAPDKHGHQFSWRLFAGDSDPNIAPRSVQKFDELRDGWEYVSNNGFGCAVKTDAGWQFFSDFGEPALDSVYGFDRVVDIPDEDSLIDFCLIPELGGAEELPEEPVEITAAAPIEVKPDLRVALEIAIKQLKHNIENTTGSLRTDTSGVLKHIEEMIG